MLIVAGIMDSHPQMQPPYISGAAALEAASTSFASRDLRSACVCVCV
jgi:hypothetical protein